MIGILFGGRFSGTGSFPESVRKLEVLFPVFEVELVALGLEDLAELR